MATKTEATEAELKRELAERKSQVERLNSQLNYLRECEAARVRQEQEKLAIEKKAAELRLENERKARGPLLDQAITDAFEHLKKATDVTTLAQAASAIENLLSSQQLLDEQTDPMSRFYRRYHR